MGIKVTYSVYIESNSGTKADVLTNLPDRTEALESALKLNHIVKEAGYRGKACKVVNHDGEK
jgi:hypothetical protein